MEDYKGFNIPKDIIIVSRDCTIYNYQTGQSTLTGECQGYVVPADNTKTLESALSWSGYKDTDEQNKHIHKYRNGTFTISISSSASSSSQGGKLSFWECKITAEDGKEFFIGVNAEFLCKLLLNANFEKGVCTEKVWLGKQRGNTGVFTSSMDEYKQAMNDEALRERKLSTKYNPGQLVYTKSQPNLVYLGELYHRCFLYEYYKSRYDRRVYYLVIPNKPNKCHIYGEFKYESEYVNRQQGRSYTVDKTKLAYKKIVDRKISAWFDGDVIDIKDTKSEFDSIVDNEYSYSSEDYTKARKEYQKLCYGENPDVTKYCSKEELLAKMNSIVKRLYPHYSNNNDYILAIIDEDQMKALNELSENSIYARSEIVQ